MAVGRNRRFTPVKEPGAVPDHLTKQSLRLASGTMKATICKGKGDREMFYLPVLAILGRVIEPGIRVALYKHA